MDYLVYIFFAGGFLFFLFSLKEGYLSKKGEDVKYQVFLDDDQISEVKHGR